ncbi:zinc finger protein 888-like [Musca domestica]|uniref:Zinc finger protein 888-like n=1 Tax=Musca domestica TaxID=7370 RepID=A0ABM3UXN7_MUSDO|nr:zinc finger protein 888-like [Musca domestica]XP_058978305.1 zinc finger protein 888-like [Musca domestica]
MAPNVNSTSIPYSNVEQPEMSQIQEQNSNEYFLDSEENEDFSLSASEWSGGESDDYASSDDSNTSDDDDIPLAEYKQKIRSSNQRKSLQESTKNMIGSRANENPGTNGASEERNHFENQIPTENPKRHKTAYDFDVSDEDIKNEVDGSFCQASGENFFPRSSFSAKPPPSPKPVWKIKREHETAGEIYYSQNQGNMPTEQVPPNIRGHKRAFDFDLSDEETQDPTSNGHNFNESQDEWDEFSQPTALGPPAAYKYDSPDDDELANSGHFSTNTPRSTKTFSYRNHLKRPQTLEEYDDLIAKWRPSLECRICKANCNRFRQLQLHFSEHHPDEECYVQCCRLQLRYRYEFEKHIYYHRVEGAYKCDICYAIFTQLSGLDRHHSRYHRPGPIDAEVETLKCHKCGKEFREKFKCRVHQNYCEGGQAEGPRPITCPDCGKSFKCKKILRTHRIQYHRENAVSQCHICDKILSCPANLRYHLLCHGSERKYACTVCHKTFKDANRRREHIRALHVEEYKEHLKKKFELRKNKKCDQCDKVYRTSTALKEHKAQHEGITALYKCKYCTKSYKYSSNMAAHVQRVHPTKYRGKVKKPKRKRNKKK